MKPVDFLVKGVLALVALLFIAGPIYGDDTSQEQKSADQTAPLAAQSQSYLGVSVSPLPPAVQAQLSEVIGADRGVLIKSVMKGSPADRAALRAHDIIITFDNHDVSSADQLAKLVQNSKPESEIILGYIRGGRLHEAKVMPGTHPEDQLINASGAGRTGTRNEGGNPERERQRQNDPRPWASFKAMTVT
jgi:predicted metalloprotease with PDZ domain